MISTGLALASFSETYINVWGVSIVLAASCLGGLRWALSQRLIVFDSAFAESPLLLVSKVVPWSAGATALAAVFVDGKRLYRIATVSGWQGPQLNYGRFHCIWGPHVILPIVD